MSRRIYALLKVDTAILCPLEGEGDSLSLLLTERVLMYHSFDPGREPESPAHG